ncbi:hypothetical protein Chor_014042 [Crotalus horridus]
MIWILQLLFSPLPTPALIGLITFGTTIFLWLITKPKPITVPFDLSKQSVGTEGGGRRNPLVPEGQLLSYFFEDAKTLYEGFRRGRAVSAHIFIFAENGPCLGYRKPKQPYQWISYQQWVISELACYTYSMIVVPLYDTLGAEAIVYIVNKADISTVICDKPEKAETILENCEQGKMPGLKRVILMDPFDERLKEKGVALGIEILSFQEVEKAATYGTSDVAISYLPLAHMFERVVQSIIYSIGARVGFFQGDIKLLVDDMKALKPTLFPVVPRVLNRIYDKQLTGGKMKLIVTGAAPISPSVITFLRGVFGCHIAEAYGQTECSAGCTFTIPGDWKAGHVGPPLPCNIIKLEDVPEMNYFASNNEGEVCIKGPNVFKGYLKDPEKTAEALDSNGWLHTGDIGKWMPNNVLKIIDRKKNIFKLSQGEYIAPEKIENIYIRSPFVAQVFVHGDSLQSFLVGIVVPDEETLPAFAENLGVKGSFEELCKNSVVKNAVLMDMNKLGKEAGLKTFEQVKYIYLHPELFTVENGLLTPTLKSRRADLVKRFRSQIDALYASDM